MARTSIASVRVWGQGLAVVLFSFASALLITFAMVGGESQPRAHEARPLWIALLGLSLGFMVCGIRSGTATMTEDEVIFRELFRSRRFALESVRRFSVVSGRQGIGYRRKFFALTTTAGQVITSQSLNTSWRSDKLDSAATRFNNALLANVRRR